MLTAGYDSTARIWDAKTGELRRIIVPLLRGRLTINNEGHYRAEGEGLECLSYYDPDDHNLLRTLWKAEDLPRLMEE